MRSQSAIGGTLRAKCCASASWSPASRLTANRPASRSGVCDCDACPIETPTSAGSSESETSEPTVSAYLRSSASTVTTATGAAARRIASLSSSPATATGLDASSRALVRWTLRVAEAQDLLVGAEVQLAVVRPGGVAGPGDDRRDAGPVRGRPVALAHRRETLPPRVEPVAERAGRPVEEKAVVAVPA